MRRLRTLFGVVVLLAGLGRAAPAQTVDLYVSGYDSLVVLTGDTASAELWVSNIPASTGVSQYSIDLLLDSNRVRVVAVDTLPGQALPVPMVTWLSSERVRLSGSGTGLATSTARLGVVTFEMDPLAQEGSLVSFVVNSLLDQAGASLLPSHRTDLLDVCQANRIYGDVDVNRAVNSRDALITLTSSVGIPVGAPFELQWGDVDLDLQVTSRDALFILSAGIGLSVPFGVVTGQGVPNRCAPLEPAPADMAFFRGTLYRIDAGDSVPQPVSLDPMPLSSYRASWAPDGSRIAYTGWTAAGFGYEIIAVNRDGSSPDTLTRNSSTDISPAWSPDGTQIAFLATSRVPRGIYLMDTDGTNQVHVPGTDTLTLAANEIAWSPDGTKIAFAAYGSATPSGPLHPWTADLVGQTLQPVPTTTIQNGTAPSWSSGSDSLVFYSTFGAGRLYAMAVPDTAGVPASSLLYVQNYPWWAPTGIVFQSSRVWPYRLLLLRADGRHLRLTAGGPSSHDMRPVMRDPNLVYVDAVSVSPSAGTIPAAAPLTLTATVTNNDLTTNATVPIRWISRDPTIATVASTGTRTADVSGVGASGLSTWIVVSAGGWRSDSAQVTVQ